MALVMIDLDDTLVQREPLVQALIDADRGGYRPRPESVVLAMAVVDHPLAPGNRWAHGHVGRA